MLAFGLKCYKCTSTKSWEDCDDKKSSEVTCTGNDVTCYKVHYSTAESAIETITQLSNVVGRSNPAPVPARSNRCSSRSENAVDELHRRFPTAGSRLSRGSRSNYPPTWGKLYMDIFRNTNSSTLPCLTLMLLLFHHFYQSMEMFIII